MLVTTGWKGIQIRKHILKSSDPHILILVSRIYI